MRVHRSCTNSRIEDLRARQKWSRGIMCMPTCAHVCRDRNCEGAGEREGWTRSFARQDLSGASRDARCLGMNPDILHRGTMRVDE